MGVYERDPKTGRRCKKGQRGVWYYYFTINGRRYRAAIPEAQNKRQALVAEANARAAVFNGTYGRKEAGQASFSDFVRGEYLNWAKEKKKSWRFDSFAVPIVAEYFKGKRFCDITPKAVEQYRDHRLSGVTIRGRKRNGNSVCRELAMMSKVFVLAIKKGYCEENPVKKVDWPHQPNRRERVVSDAEEELILSKLNGKYASLRAPILTALYSGMRRGEMFALRWMDVDFERGFVRLRETTTKNGKARTVPLIEPALSELAALRKAGDSKLDASVFPISKQYVSHLLREFLDSLGMEDVGLHTMRHSFASRAARAGIPPFYVKEILGHADMDMTAYYSHSGREDLVREAKKLEKIRTT
ncbi:MAG TPA: site-specific integrase [Blastocatellia bacterium]|nr:site-specific integrase [Blastocatellia bacterium]HMZ16674.1 site-specific integrase [Blastocatellia bacterium]HNG33875.1 site-specific integrase [Blastocatellia bacterium]